MVWWEISPSSVTSSRTAVAKCSEWPVPGKNRAVTQTQPRLPAKVLLGSGRNSGLQSSMPRPLAFVACVVLLFAFADATKPLLHRVLPSDDNSYDLFLFVQLCVGPPLCLLSPD